MVPFWTAFVATCYISSCIGWQFVLTTSFARAPSIHGGFPGGMVFVGVWVGMDLYYRSQERERVLRRTPIKTFVCEVQFDAEVVGWVTLAEVIVWSVLRGKVTF